MANQPTRILVVDDDDALRITLVDILEFAGLDVASAVDGVQAVEMATTGHFDLICGPNIAREVSRVGLYSGLVLSGV